MIALILDTETTGLIDNRSLALDKQSEVTEFCGLMTDLESGVVIAELDTLIKPQRAIPDDLVKKVGISNEMVADKEPFSAFAHDIKALIAAAPLVIAHNLSFDAEILDIEFERLGQTIKWPRKLCTVEATIHIQGYRMNLTQMHECLFGIGFPSAHRARNDVEALKRCCVELFKRGEI